MIPSHYDHEQDEIDIAKAVEATLRERKGSPGFYPPISFLQRRMQWGFIRATALRQAIIEELDRLTR